MVSPQVLFKSFSLASRGFLLHPKVLWSRGVVVAAASLSCLRRSTHKWGTPKRATDVFPDVVS